MTGRDVTVLMVDDDTVDQMAVRRAFQLLRLSNRIVAARDGLEAFDMLRGTNGCDAVAQPVLILLDLNMPRMNGIEFLQELRADPSLHRLVVFVMTTSSSGKDMADAYDRSIAGYILKQDPERPFLEALDMLDRYCRAVEFPPAIRAG